MEKGHWLAGVLIGLPWGFKIWKQNRH